MPGGLTSRWRVLCAVLIAALAAAATALLAAGCGSSDHAPHAAAARESINEHDFHIAAPGTLKAGRYTFVVHNEGATDHELLIAPVTEGRLPLRPDGLTVDEEAVESKEPGALEPGSPGSVRTLTVDLRPGRYVFFCNMEGHYMAGMRSELVVQ
ncbi:MAG TPA: plastocyanin/azurin family copper-binding protein [Solirubrobacteraceae bacterium]|nr:plastocyanin/azurin family copper-binding protein [Solirubrobacteraceae bacterium]